MATSTPNLVKISQIAAELWIFSFFQKWWPAAILDFINGQKWRNSTLWTVHVYHRAKFGGNILHGGRVIAILRFSKWRPAAILDLVQPTYRTTHDGALAVLSVLSNFISIWLIVSKILKIQFFLTFVLKWPNHAHFWGFYRVLIPCTIFFSLKPSKAHPLVKPRRLRYRSWKCVHPFLL